MSIELILNGQTFKAKSFVFSGGEVQCELPLLGDPTGLTVVARLQDSDSIIELLLVTEIIKRKFPKANRKLIIPYFPYARQDRVMKPNEAFSLKVFTNLINDLYYDEVITYDTHSTVTDALVDRIRVISQDEIVMQHADLLGYIEKVQPIIIAPDAGAVKKATAIAKICGRPIAFASKVRDINTGEVKIGNLSENTDKVLSNGQFLIIDDICDGGATFTLLAAYLKEHYAAEHIALYVTHGIFSKGYAVFHNLIDRIYTTDTFLPKNYPLHEGVPVFTHRIDWSRI